MRILYIGSVASLDEINFFSGSSIAGNKMQFNLLNNLTKIKDVELEIISITPIKPFPYDKLWVTTQRKEIFNHVVLHQIGFLNIPFIKQLWQSIKIYSLSKSIIRNKKIDKILSFNLYPQNGIPFFFLQRRFNLKSAAIIADLPIEDTLKVGLFKKIYMKLFNKITELLIKNVKNLILVNKNVVDFYKLASNYIVVEGGVDSSEFCNNIIDYKNKNNTILFSGSLTNYSGILNLISAMDFVIDKSIELHIYGDGSLRELVREKASTLQNIKFFGLINNVSLLDYQRKAYLLVNPRPIDNLINKLTFPSKIFEYLISGTVVLSTDLTCPTKEYKRNMFVVNSNDPVLLASNINQIFSLSKEFLTIKAYNARKFVMNKKNWEIQSKKVYNFLRSL